MSIFSSMYSALCGPLNWELLRDVVLLHTLCTQVHSKYTLQLSLTYSTYPSMALITFIQFLGPCILKLMKLNSRDLPKYYGFFFVLLSTSPHLSTWKHCKSVLGLILVCLLLRRIYNLKLFPMILRIQDEWCYTHYCLKQFSTHSEIQ